MTAIYYTLELFKMTENMRLITLQEIQDKPKIILKVISLNNNVGENNACIPPTLEGWAYIVPTHEPLDRPLYTWAQYTPTNNIKM